MCCSSGTDSLDMEAIGYTGVCGKLTQKCETSLLKASAEELVVFPQAVRHLEGMPKEQLWQTAAPQGEEPLLKL